MLISFLSWDLGPRLLLLLIGWSSNRTGTSVDDGKARGKDWTLLPVPNLPLCHWSSHLFDLHAPSSTDVSVLLLNQPNIEVNNRSSRLASSENEQRSHVRQYYNVADRHHQLQHDLIIIRFHFFSLFSQFSRKWRKLKQIFRLADTMMTLLVKLKTNCNVQFVGYHWKTLFWRNVWSQILQRLPLQSFCKFSITPWLFRTYPLLQVSSIQERVTGQ